MTERGANYIDGADWRLRCPKQDHDAVGRAGSDPRVLASPKLRVQRSLRRALDLYNQDRLGWMEQALALGPVVRLLIGPVTLVVVSDAEAGRSLLIADAQRWRRTPATTITAKLAIGDNLFTQGERAWAKLQPAVAPEFRKRALESRVTEINSLVSAEIAALPLDTSIDLDKVMGRIAMMVASWVLFGHHLGRERANELVESQRVVVDWLGQRVGSLWSVVPLALGSSSKVMRRSRDVLYGYADEVVDRRRHEDSPQADVLQALLEARPGGRPLGHSQLRSQVLGLFAA
ncbi:MAG TPA: cytochrome P450, partial [Acidimicrobiales bacterium]|nr:cytochrome P450 [Acidimicrobiales bacterium]